MPAVAGFAVFAQKGSANMTTYEKIDVQVYKNTYRVDYYQGDTKVDWDIYAGTNTIRQQTLLGTSIPISMKTLPADKAMVYVYPKDDTTEILYCTIKITEGVD